MSLEDHEELLAVIDEKIERINNHKAVRMAEKLMKQRDELQMARRALLGVGSKTVSSGGSRVTQGEVVEWMRANFGPHTVREIAESMGYPEATIRGHLNRGAGERFDKDPNGNWELRDPETEEDSDGSNEG